MWSTRREELSSGRVLKFAVELDGKPIAFRDVLQRWQVDTKFREFFIGLLAQAPFMAFRWETPPLSEANAQQPFEFVLLDSPDLPRQPDPDAFAEHFRSAAAPQTVVTFLNLGRDAVLVVPRPIADVSAYGHLTAFVREAPEAQKHALWEQVGHTMEQRLSAKPAWLSTAGAGVSWLHVRLDDRPKYYGYEPYRANSPDGERG